MKLEDDDGDQQWGRPFDIAATRHGEATVVGSFRTPVDLGTGLLTPDRSDAFVLRLGRGKGKQQASARQARPSASREP